MAIQFEVNVKRFYMPGVLVTKPCPKCGQPCTNDRGQEYFSYPTANSEVKLGLYCQPCDYEWEVKAFFTITLEVKD